MCEGRWDPSLLGNLPTRFPELRLEGGELVENSGSNHKMLLLAIYDFVIKYDYNIYLYNLVVDPECLETCR